MQKDKWSTYVSLSRCQAAAAPAASFSRLRSLAESVWSAMCLHIRLLCGALWWPVLKRCARAARPRRRRRPDDDYDQVCPRRHPMAFCSVHLATDHLVLFRFLAASPLCVVFLCHPATCSLLFSHLVASLPFYFTCLVASVDIAACQSLTR